MEGALPSPATVMESHVLCVAKVSLQLPNEEMEKAGESPGH